MRITVHISEDSSEMRTLMRRWLERDARIHIVGEAGDGHEALRGLTELQPDVALLDLTMPRSLGAAMVATIRERCPHTRVLVITGTALDRAQRVLDKADGYLLKPAPMAELAGLICELAAGAPAAATTHP